MLLHKNILKYARLDLGAKKEEKSGVLTLSIFSSFISLFSLVYNTLLVQIFKFIFQIGIL